MYKFGLADYLHRKHILQQHVNVQLNHCGFHWKNWLWMYKCLTNYHIQIRIKKIVFLLPASYTDDSFA